MADREDDERTRHIAREISPGPKGNNQQQGGGAGQTRIHQPGKAGGSPPPPSPQPSPDPGRQGQGSTVIHPQDTNHTKLYRPGAQPPPVEQPAPVPAPSVAKVPEDTFDPVTGWLVAISGPGKGKSRPIFEGRNSAGRDPSQRIPLDFDDQAISREKHFWVIYEPRERRFDIVAGEKANLVYVNGKALRTEAELTDGSVIEIGKTKLRFVPLCGPGFSWDEA
jgi:FHA domain-containing protein